MYVAFVSIDVNFYARDAVLFHAALRQFEFVDVEFFEFGFQGLKREAGVDERAEDHVAADACKCVEVCNFHRGSGEDARFWGKQAEGTESVPLSRSFDRCSGVGFRVVR